LNPASPDVASTISTFIKGGPGCTSRSSGVRYTKNRGSADYARSVLLLATWKVKHGMVARFRAFGSSMEPVIPSGSTVTIEPVDVDKVELGDIVVAEVGDSTMLHLVKAIDVDRRLVEISGTSATSGWTSFDRVFAICTRIGEEVVPGARAKAKR
jgi:hypothetical protein